MRDRCLNPRFKQFADYGGRGISICARWDDFHAFVADMGPRPEGYTLDRKDNDKGYDADNCRWASRKMQQRNRRIARYVEIEGKRYRAIELADIAGVKLDTIIERAEKGWPYAEVISREKHLNITGFAIGGLANGARQRARTHCKRGHEFDEANTYITPQGMRQCRQCQNAKMRRLNAAKRATAQ